MPRIWIVDRAGRPYLELQWRHPVTGKLVTRSTRTRNRRSAEKLAAQLEVQLEESTTDAAAQQRLSWADLCAEYARAVFPAQAESTRAKMRATWAKVRAHLNPERAASVQAAQLRQLTGKLRDEGLAEFTVKGHLAELKKLFRWAVDQELLAKVPRIHMPQRVAGMKGRPVTGEEFERMRAATAKVVGADRAASWLRLLDGLWLSGLRLAEAMRLHWTRDTGWTVDSSGKHVMLRVRAQNDKARKDRVLPVAGEFAEFLLATPPSERTGWVFHPLATKRPSNFRLTAEQVGKVISKIGRAANVRVSDRDHARRKAGREPGKFASAHDLRRAFGVRMAQRVMPVFLQQLMRHASIQTTMEFYVGRDADLAAEMAAVPRQQPAPNTAPNSWPEPDANTPLADPKSPGFSAEN
jgi:integrase